MLSVESKVKELVKHPEVIEIIDSYVEGFSTNKQLKMAYGMTFKQISPMCALTPEQTAEVNEKILALNIAE